MEPSDLANAAEAIGAIDRASLDPSGLLASFGIQPAAPAVEPLGDDAEQQRDTETPQPAAAAEPGSTAAEILARMGLSIDSAESDSAESVEPTDADDAVKSNSPVESATGEGLLSEPPLSAQLLSQQLLSEQMSAAPVDQSPPAAVSSEPAISPEPHVAPEPAVSSEPHVEPAAGGNDEEESIEAYMNRLLRRVQGMPSDEAAEPATGASAAAPAATSGSAASSGASAGTLAQTPDSRVGATVAAEQSVGPAAASTAAAGPSSAGSAAPTAAEFTAGVADSQQPLTAESPYVPRSSAPERSGNLAAMRELANSSARSAIATSARRRMANEALFKFAIFGLGVLAGLATLVGTDFAVGRWLIVALCCFALSGFFLYEALNLRKRLQSSSPAASSATVTTATPETVATSEPL